MAVANNDIFRMVSLRGPLSLTDDPSEGIYKTDLLKELDNTKPDPGDPDLDLAPILNRHRPISRHEAEATTVAALARGFSHAKDLSVEKLASIKVELASGEALDIVKLIDRDDFTTDMAHLYDTWILKNLGEALNRKYPIENPVHLENVVDIAYLEDLLRAGRLAQRYRREPSSLTVPGICKDFMKSKVVYPRSWRAAHYFRKQIEAVDIKDEEERVQALGKEKSGIQKAKEQYLALARQMNDIDNIQAKAILVHMNLLAEAREERATIKRMRTENVESGAAAIKQGVKKAPLPVARVENDFEAKLVTKLSEEERGTLEVIKQRFPGILGRGIEEFQPWLSQLRSEIVLQAGKAYQQLFFLEKDAKKAVPPKTSRRPSKVNRPSVRAIGFGDLIVARERLIGYEANEVAHIENVLPYENRLRRHERITSREELIETEETKETTRENELQTTDRYELQSQSEKTLSEEFAIDTGVNISASYGVVDMETSLEAGFSRSSSESNSSSSTLAKEVVSRAVERTHESARELRRTIVTEQIRELNRHSINNQDGKFFSGVYCWVEKIQEVQLYHYGTRLMIEFYVPEPACSLLERKDVDFEEPEELEIKADDINDATYLTEALKFGVTDIEPPPAPYVQVGYAWSYKPTEGERTSTGALLNIVTAHSSLKLPEGYAPIEAQGWFTGMNYEQAIDMHVAVGGVPLIDREASAKDLIPEPSGPEEGPVFRGIYCGLAPVPAPEGLPVTVRGAVKEGGGNLAAAVNIRVNCARTDETYTAWKLKVFDHIKEAHQRKVDDYERKLAQAAVYGPITTASRNPSENRSQEAEELRKWAIKTLRNQTFDFDSVVAVPNTTEERQGAAENKDEYYEIDPGTSWKDAEIVRFFEESFEWRNMSYAFYPYYWGRRSAYSYRAGLRDSDPLHELFLRAGGARMVVPVTPGFEERILYYLNMPNKKELDRIRWVPPTDLKDPKDVPVCEAENAWIEVLKNKNRDVVLGSGTLEVKNGEDLVRINDNSLWIPDSRDIGRELYIGGNCYTLVKIAFTPEGGNTIKLDRPYEGPSNPRIRYAAGSLPIGNPWQVRVPTSLVILSEQKAKLKLNIERNEFGTNDGASP